MRSAECGIPVPLSKLFFFFNDTATTEIYTLSLHDALPISGSVTGSPFQRNAPVWWTIPARARSSDDLPEPTGPTTSTSCPRSTVRSMSRAATVPSSWTALNPARSSRRSGCRGAVAGAGAVPADRSTPGTDAEYAPTPDMATVRRVHTRAEGSCETRDAVVQANHRAAPSVATATRVAPGDSPPDRYSAHTPTGSSPLTMEGVDRAHTCTEVSRRCRSLRTPSSRARCASTGRVAPASFTVRAAESDDTSAVANAARAATVFRAERSSSGPNRVAASPETSIVPAKNIAGTAVPDTRVIEIRMTAQMNWSIRLSASITTRSVSPPWATTSAGVCALTRRGPVWPCTRRRLIRSIWRTHHSGYHLPV